MFRLIKVDVASTGKPYSRDGTPLRFLNFGAHDIFLRERSHFGFQIVAQEIEFMDTILIRRVECGFGRRQGEDQPAMAGIHGWKAENVAEKARSASAFLL